MKWIKRIGFALGGLVALVLIALGAVYLLTELRFKKTYTVAAEDIAPPTDSATLERGRHLATAIAKCTDCHGEHLQGQAFIDQAPMGRLVALNLTSGEGGIGAQLTPADIERAVRHGVGRSGRSLRIMPSVEYQYLSDADLKAIVAYVKSVPPVNNVLPGSNIMLLPRLVMTFGAMPILAAEEIGKNPGAPMTPTPGPTAEYGGYLAWVGGCKGCHGPNLSGGKIVGGPPDWPPAANLTPSGNPGKWSEQDFVQTLRTGKRPDGTPLNSAMPWKLSGQMTDDEMHALWTYLKSVPPRTSGTH